MTAVRPAGPGIDRRRFLTASLLGLGGLAVAGCQSTGNDSAGAATTVGTSSVDPTWTFTDDLGVTVTLPKRPERIAGLTDQIAALWGFGIKPVAAFGYQAMADDVQFTGLDTTGVQTVGATYGEINMEALLAAAPDLIVTTSYPVDPTLPYGFNDQAQLDQVTAIAPVVAIAQKGVATDVIARNAELAGLLGADLQGQLVTDAKADFDKASAAVTAAAGTGLQVMALGAYDDAVYVAQYTEDPGLAYAQRSGVGLVDLNGNDGYWETLSWENIDKYPVDVVLYSLRAMTKDAMMAQPTFASLPAAAAGQVYPWEFMSMDYRGQAIVLGNLAENLSAARKVV